MCIVYFHSFMRSKNHPVAIFSTFLYQLFIFVIHDCILATPSDSVVHCGTSINKVQVAPICFGPSQNGTKPI